jgi:hypothetical protein
LILSALPVELRLCIDYFSAKRVEEAGPWPVYRSVDGTVILVETGLGMLSAAAATAHVFSHFSIPLTCTVLNLGIAGSGHFKIGQWVLAHEVIDTSTKNHYYLRPPSVQGLPCGTLRTYSKPSFDYGLKDMLDMEAAGVVSAAKRYVAMEQIWVAKLVSDRSFAEQRALDKKAVWQLFQDQFNALTPVLAQAIQYSEQQESAMNVRAIPAEWLLRFHFSVSHKRRLDRLWRSYRVFFPETDFVFSQFSSAKEVICFLENRLKTVSGHWREE